MKVRLCLSCLGVFFLLFGISIKAEAVNVYVMNSGNSTCNSLIISALESAGHKVTIGELWYNQNGNQSLSSFDVVVFLEFYSYNHLASMSIAGQNEIIDFVSNGGGLVTGEWFIYSLGFGGFFDKLLIISPVISTLEYRSNLASITYTRKTYDSILSDGVANTFTFTPDEMSFPYHGAETYFTPREGSVVYYASDYPPKGGALIGWNYHAGRVISFSTGIGLNEMQNSDYQMLFVNSVEWAVYRNLVYMPVTPCRIVDTRKSGGAIPPGGIRSYNVRGAVASQGGNPAGCPSLKGEPRAVHINVTSVPLGNGWITAYPFGSAAPLASLVNYRSDAQNVANSGTIKTCFNCTKDINIKSGGSKTHVIIDVLGYYYSKP